MRRATLHLFPVMAWAAFLKNRSRDPIFAREAAEVCAWCLALVILVGGYMIVTLTALAILLPLAGGISHLDWIAVGAIAVPGGFIIAMGVRGMRRARMGLHPCYPAPREWTERFCRRIAAK